MTTDAFATVVSTANGLPMASHLPVELREARSGLSIFGHMARGNSLWKSFKGDSDVLVIFLGPHAYVSPTWYAAPAVPTWNYMAVHAYGRPRLIEEKDELLELLERLVRKHETNNASSKSFSLDELPAEKVKGMMVGVVGFEIVVTRIETAAKLSQNRSAADFDGVVGGLRGLKDDNSLRVADAMTQIRRDSAGE